MENKLILSAFYIVCHQVYLLLRVLMLRMLVLRVLKTLILKVLMPAISLLKILISGIVMT